MEGLLPGLPDDLALLCLARIPWSKRGKLKAVCRGWLHVLSSGALHEVRKSHGLLHDFLCASPGSQRRSDGVSSLVVKLYEVPTSQWIALPPMPLWTESHRFIRFQLVGCDTELFVIGGAKYSHDFHERLSTVWVFDFLSGKWKPGPDLCHARSSSRAALVDRRLYVLDGALEKTTEVLDLNQCPGMWRSFENPFSEGDRCLGCVVSGKELRAICMSYEGTHNGHAHVLNMESNRWTSVDKFSEPKGGMTWSFFGQPLAPLAGEVHMAFFVLDRDQEYQHVFALSRRNEAEDAWERVALIPREPSKVAGEVILDGIMMLPLEQRLIIVYTGEVWEDDKKHLDVNLFSIASFRDSSLAPTWEVEDRLFEWSFPCRVEACASVKL